MPYEPIRENAVEERLYQIGQRLKHQLLPRGVWNKFIVLKYPASIYGEPDADTFVNFPENSLKLVKTGGIYFRKVNKEIVKFYKYRHIATAQRGTHIKIPLEVRAAGAWVGIEGRNRYYDKIFPDSGDDKIHSGIDFYTRAGTPVFAPLEGKVVLVVNELEEGDPRDPDRRRTDDPTYAYGPYVVLRHEVPGGKSEKPFIFFTLYGHLSLGTVRKLRKGQIISAGKMIGRIGTTEVNGFWQPHLHFQVMTSEEDAKKKNIIGAAKRRELTPEFLERYPNPALLFPHAPWAEHADKRNEFRAKAENVRRE